MNAARAWPWLELVAIVGLVAGCGERAVDWSGPEDFLLREDSTKTEEGIRLDYWSLVDAPPHAVYDALADVEHYSDFIPGVDVVNLLELTDDTKTVQIAQRVLGRQSNAKVEWKFLPDRRRIEFKTLQSNLSRNDGSYEVESSPDGTRSLVRTVFLVHEGEGSGASVPIGVLASATRETFLAAAAGVKKRATGG